MAVATRDWNALARRSRYIRQFQNAVLISFLTVISIPVVLPFFWVLTISFSARTGGVESAVLWRACGVLVPAVIAYVVAHLTLKSVRR